MAAAIAICGARTRKISSVPATAQPDRRMIFVNSKSNRGSTIRLDAQVMGTTPRPAGARAWQRPRPSAGPALTD